MRKSKIQDWNIRQNYKIYYIYKTMFTFCLKCRNNTEGKNQQISKTKYRKIMLHYVPEMTLRLV